MNFTPAAIPFRDGIEMRNGNGELKGFTMRKCDRHQAYVVIGEHVKLIGEFSDIWDAYGLVETWYGKPA